jgi:hypothetical protein
MITRFSFFVTVGLIAISCGSKERDSQTDNISGVYIREYSFKVIHPERGDTIGMRTIRDTIFIRQKDQGYEVSNNKWSLNDYDIDGWKNMEHAEDHSMPTFHVTFNLADGSLDSESMQHLFLDLERGQLYKDKNQEKPYQKFRK